MSKSLVILGSTGSIGEQALDVARQNGYVVKAIAAGKSIDKLEAQAREFSVEAVAVFDETAANELKTRLADTNISVLCGTEGVCEVASIKADIVLNAIVGIAGLRPMFAAMNAKKRLAMIQPSSKQIICPVHIYSINEIKFQMKQTIPPFMAEVLPCLYLSSRNVAASSAACTIHASGNW